MPGRSSKQKREGKTGLGDSMAPASIAIGMSLGLCFGAVMGAATQNLALGVGFGVAIGVAFSMTFGATSLETLARKKASSDKPLPRPLGL